MGQYKNLDKVTTMNVQFEMKLKLKNISVSKH